ncbi:hypothetical protein [Poriferisphaera sp. WC338]|uniref:hypothetical protein n=1 Tax=Poriferisphaera sp. WC338 TaxID=3425129 RepID=UPI003D81C31A
MSNRFFPLAVFGFVALMTAVLSAQWSTSQSSSFNSEVRLEGRLERVHFSDGTIMTPGQLDGVKQVKVYDDFIVVRKPGRTGAAIIPMESLKYLMLD